MGITFLRRNVTNVVRGLISVTMSPQLSVSYRSRVSQFVAAFLIAYSSVSFAQLTPPPCPNYDAPRLRLRSDLPQIFPNQPVSISELFTLEKPSIDVAISYIGVCMRRKQSEKEFYDVKGVPWKQELLGRFDIACTDIDGSMINSATTRYGTSWSGASVVYGEAAREKFVSFLDWTVVYQLVGEQIPFGAWACQAPISAPIPVGFDPKLVLLSPQLMYGGVVREITPDDLVKDTNKLQKGFATKVVADGSSAAIVAYRVGMDSDASVHLTLSAAGGVQPGELSHYRPNVLAAGAPTGSTTLEINSRQFITVKDRLGQSSKYALAIYRAPEPTFPIGAAPSTLRVHVSQGETSMRVTLPLVAPPVLLVHGLWGGESTFKDWSSLDYPTYRIKPVFYDGTQSWLNTGNLAKLAAEVRGLQIEMIHSGIVGGRVDVVGHSMGGLLIRAYMARDAYSGRFQDGGSRLFGHGGIHRVVFLDTPHLGSPLADVLWRVKDRRLSLTTYNRCDQFSRTFEELVTCEASSNVNGTTSSVAEALGRKIDTAIGSLGTDGFAASEMVSSLPDFRGISSYASARDPLLLGLNTLLLLFGEQDVGTIFFDSNRDTAHDGIVGAKSQEAFGTGGLSLGPYEANHLTVTDLPVVRRDVSCYLAGGSCASRAQSKSPNVRALAAAPSGAEWEANLGTRTLSNAAGVIQVDAPLQRGMRGSMYVTVRGKGVISAYAVIDSSPLDRDFHFRLQSNGGSEWIRIENVQVPYADTANVTMVVLFQDNTYGVYRGSFPVGLAPSGNYQEPQLAQDFIPMQVGGTHDLKVVAKGQIGPVVFPASAYDMAVESGTDVVSLSPAGTLTALKEGVAEVSVSRPGSGIWMLANIQVGMPLPEPLPVAPEIHLTGVEFIDLAPVASLTSVLGQGVTSSIVLANEGNDGLQVGAVNWDRVPPATTVQTNGCSGITIAPGASCAITLRFAPTSAGSGEGKLLVASNDPLYPTLPVRVLTTATTSAAPPPAGGGSTPPPSGGGGGSTPPPSGGGGGAPPPASAPKSGGGGSSDLITLLALALLMGGMHRRKNPQERRRATVSPRASGWH